MNDELRELPADFDLIVVGAGGAGLAAALFGAISGLGVLVIERSARVGGTTALAAGALWIPNTHLDNGNDTPERARRYLMAATGRSTPDARVERFLSLGPEAVRQLTTHGIALRAFSHHPDYLSDLPDASLRGRVLECEPFDGRLLGPAFGLVRPPIPEFTVLGGMMVDRIDIGHLLGATRSYRSLRHSAGLVTRQLADRLRYPRGTRLVMGNALIGRLLHALRVRRVPVLTQARVRGLCSTNDRITGVDVEQAGRRRTIGARLGVVLATGGFGDHPALRAAYIPEGVRYSPRAGGATGEMIDLALAAGAALSDARDGTAFWAPVSVRRRADGSTAVFPHFVLDRAKPGTVVVDDDGDRFLDESVSYHRFGERMLESADGHPPRAGAWLIADHRAVTRYGLGIVRPGGRGLSAALADGYLVAARDVVTLAQKIGVDADRLADAVARIARFSRTGVDEDFGRGATAYARNLGDPAHRPNPTLAPLQQPPFYALRLLPGDIAVSAGLITDADARVLRGDAPIPGLFAIGNDMHSIMGRHYPGPGINLGPAVVFAYAAVRAAQAAQ